MLLTLLSPLEKRVTAKNLILNGYSSRKVEEIFGISDTTALRYAKEATPDELKQFEADFKNIIEQIKQKGLSLAMKRMLAIIPKYNRLDHLVKAAEYFERGKDQVFIQQNIDEKMSIEFVAQQFDAN